MYLQNNHGNNGIHIKNNSSLQAQYLQFINNSGDNEANAYGVHITNATRINAFSIKIVTDGSSGTNQTFNNLSTSITTKNVIIYNTGCTNIGIPTTTTTT